MKCVLIGCLLCALLVAQASPLKAAQELPLQLSITAPHCWADTTAVGNTVVQQLTPAGCAPAGSGLQMGASLFAGQQLQLSAPPLKLTTPLLAGMASQPLVLSGAQAASSYQRASDILQVKSDQFILGTVAAFVVSLSSFMPLLPKRSRLAAWQVKKFLNFSK